MFEKHIEEKIEILGGFYGNGRVPFRDVLYMHSLKSEKEIDDYVRQLRKEILKDNVCYEVLHGKKKMKTGNYNIARRTYRIWSKLHEDRAKLFCINNGVRGLVMSTEI